MAFNPLFEAESVGFGVQSISNQETTSKIQQVTNMYMYVARRWGDSFYQCDVWRLIVVFIMCFAGLGSVASRTLGVIYVRAIQPFKTVTALSA